MGTLDGFFGPSLVSFPVDWGCGGGRDGGRPDAAATAAGGFK